MNAIESPETEQEPRSLSEYRDLASRVEGSRREVIQAKMDDLAFELENKEPIEALREFVVEISRFFHELESETKDETVH